MTESDPPLNICSDCDVWIEAAPLKPPAANGAGGYCTTIVVLCIPSRWIRPNKVAASFG